MAHIREVTRSTGIKYECRWVANGKERQRTFSVKRDAERFALKVEQDLADGASTDALVSRGKTVAQVVEASLAASRPKLKESTYAGYVHLYGMRVLPVFGRQRISSVTSEAVESWLAEMIGAGLSASTVHNHHVALNKVFRYAMRHRLIAYNPCDGVELPRLAAESDFAPVFLTAGDVEKIASAMDSQPPFGTLIRFAAFSGLRSAEIAGLRVRDVNLAAGHIEVRQTIRRVSGEWAVGTPKSARSTRNVPLLNRGLIAELRMLLLSHPDSGNPDALFWPARAYSTHAADWSRPCDVGSIRRHAMAAVVEELGMPPMRFHDLRHTYASLMFAAGFKPYEVSRWIGHASVATTDSIYAHLYPSDYNEQIAKFESFVALG